MAFTSCDSKESEKQKTNSVQHYLDHADERKKQIAICANNPGDHEDDPNCVNAYEADKEAMDVDMDRAIKQE